MVTFIIMQGQDIAIVIIMIIFLLFSVLEWYGLSATFLMIFHLG